MSKPFTAHPYQQIMMDFGLSVPRSAWFAGMGVGKTVSALTLIDTLIMVGHSDPVLVLGPKRVATETWAKEAQKWDHLKHLTIMPAVGNVQQRRGALLTPAEVYTTNYEQLPWLVDLFEGRPWPFKTIVADESTRLKGFRTKQGGQRAGALARVAKQTERWINLTGTPSPNGLKDLWGQFWFLDFGARLGDTYTAFMDRWFKTDYDGVVTHYPHAEREIYSRIEDITISIRAKDWFDLEEPIQREVRVTLPPAARKAYKELERDMFAKLACGTEVEAFNAAALTNKCRQLANGAVYTERPAWAAVHDAKIEALDSIVSEANGMPVLVAYDFVSDKERILKAFKGAVDISKPEGMAEFRKGKVKVGVAHPASMGHGIDGLQDVTNILVYFGHDWNLELRQQILERIGPMRQKQSGHDRPVWVYSIIADDTLDDVVIERHRTKRSTQELLIEAMRKQR